MNNFYKNIIYILTLKYCNQLKMKSFYYFTIFTLIIIPTILSQTSSNFRYKPKHLYISNKTNTQNKEINIPILQSTKINPSNDLKINNTIEMFFDKEKGRIPILSKYFEFPSTVSNLEVYVDDKMEYNNTTCNNTKINYEIQFLLIIILM